MTNVNVTFDGISPPSERLNVFSVTDPDGNEVIVRTSDEAPKLEDGWQLNGFIGTVEVPRQT